jgi:hypothetical protein
MISIDPLKPLPSGLKLGCEVTLALAASALTLWAASTAPTTASARSAGAALCAPASLHTLHKSLFETPRTAARHFRSQP